MKAQVYGFYDWKKDRLHWQISFSIEVDIVYWFDTMYGNRVDELYVVSSEFSIGQAIALMDCLNANRNLQQCYRKLNLAQSADNLVQISRENSRHFVSLENRNEIKRLIGKIQRAENDLFDALEGRQLLWEELEKAVDFYWIQTEAQIQTQIQTQLKNNPLELAGIVQLGVLHGKIKVTSGVSYPLQLYTNTTNNKSNNIPNNNLNSNPTPNLASIQNLASTPNLSNSNLISRITSTIKSKIFQKRHTLICNRCQTSNQVVIRECLICQEPCATCERCISMGRSRTCTPLFYFPMRPKAESTKVAVSKVEVKVEGEGKVEVGVDGNIKSPSNFLNKEIKLSSHQQKIAEQAVQFLQQNRKKELLIWAVTGAGKTEMIYPVIEEAMAKTAKVLLAAPRRDVIRELTPRLQQAFPSLEIATLYGGSKETWKNATLFLATTHQLIRFRSAFDLIIVDEMDAFPYHNDLQLQAYVQRALSKQGKIIYLTATPDEHWLEKVRRKKTELAVMPIRYHQQSLPIPKIIILPKQKQLSRSHTVKEIREFIEQVSEREGQAFLFVPNVEMIPFWVQQFQQWFPNKHFVGVHAGDKKRDQKVDLFKKNRIQFLITTTIMERGITIPNLHVLVLDADFKLFDSATLIQIAGRVGRSKEYPDGLVWFIAKKKTEAMIKARKEIIRLNKLGLKLR